MYPLFLYRYRYDVVVVFILAMMFYDLMNELWPFFNFVAFMDRSSVNNIGYILLRCISFVYIIVFGMFERGFFTPFSFEQTFPSIAGSNILWQKYRPNVHNFKKIFELYTNKLTKIWYCKF